MSISLELLNRGAVLRALPKEALMSLAKHGPQAELNGEEVRGWWPCKVIEQAVFAAALLASPRLLFRRQFGRWVKRGYKLTLNVSPPVGGTLIFGPSPGPGGTYEPGQAIFLAAYPKPGYVFAGWSGDLAVSTGSVVIIMNSAKSVAANFHML